MRTPLAAITLGFTLLMGATSASAIPLYRGLTTPSQTPKEQGWTYLFTPFPTAPSVTATTRGTILDSGATRNYAGYFLTSPSPVDRNTGYALSFGVQINSESHNSDNRAGFSIILVSNPLAGESQPYAIELGFWENSIWAQNVGFTRGENVSLNTQSAVKNYVLYIKDNQYKLYMQGSTTPILEGPLRQYTGFEPPAGFPNPYTTPNLIFMGDDTTSATANITLSRVYASPVTQSP